MECIRIRISQKVSFFFLSLIDVHEHIFELCVSLVDVLNIALHAFVILIVLDLLISCRDMWCSVSDAQSPMDSHFRTPPHPLPIEK